MRNFKFDLFDLIDLKYDEYYQFLIDIVSLESPTSDKAAVDKVAKFVRKFCEEKGFEVVEQKFEVAGNSLVITANETANIPPVLFLAHLDTVHRKGSFGENCVRAEGDKLYGPGIADCKGGIAVALLTMDALCEMGCEIPMKLILTGDEEDNRYSGDEGADFIFDAVEGAVAAFNCESAMDGSIVVGRKGVMRWYIDIVGKASHSGSFYADGISAIKEAAHKIIAIEEKSDPKRVTYNCGTITGGTLPNIVPENCRVVVDVRYNSAKEYDEANTHLQDICNTSFVGAKAKLRIRSKRSPMYSTDENMRLFEYIKSTCKAYGLESEYEPVVRGGGSDSTYTVQRGIPTVDGMGITGSGFHTDSEYAIIESLAENAKRLAVCVENIKKFTDKTERRQ